MRDELGWAREQLHAAMRPIMADLEAARREFDAMIREVHGDIEAPRDWTQLGEWVSRPKPRRPRRKPPGGEPLPVKPRPKPTPLMDGAEAPIE